MQDNDRLLIELSQKLAQIKKSQFYSVNPFYDSITNTQIGQEIFSQDLQNTQSNFGNIGINNGPTGPTGPTGPIGPTGSCECKCQTILIAEDYNATDDDYYIGVDSTNPVTVILPPDVDDCKQIIVKAEMGPPLGNRKVTISTRDGSTIDGATEYVMSVPYESVQLLSRGGNWHII